MLLTINLITIPFRAVIFIMKKLLFIFSLFAFHFSLFTELRAQNLVPNPSFEEKNNCPNNFNQINYTNYWFGTNDDEYFNSCDTVAPALVGVPQNRCGYQYAHTGDAYAGIYLFWINNNDFSDYLEVELTSALIANKRYCVNFYVSLEDSERYAVDAIEAYFSKVPISITSWQTLPYHPQISNYGHGIISNKTDWTLISGDFIAQGCEKYITIGNFRLKDSLNYLYVGNGIEDLAYYYIDDVSVIECDTTSENELTLPNAFTPDGDGVNDYFKINGKNIKSVTGKIFNRWGEELFKYTDINSKWDGTYKGKYVSAGTYFYMVNIEFTDGEIQEKQGSVEVVR